MAVSFEGIVGGHVGDEWLNLHLQRFTKDLSRIHDAIFFFHLRSLVFFCYRFFSFCYFRVKWQSLEEELNRRQVDIRQLTEAAGRLQEQQVLEYRALIGSLTLRWQELHRQFLIFQGRPEKSDLDREEQSRHIMGGPDFVSRVNKLREAIASVSRQLHSPPLTLKKYEQLSGQEDSVKVSLTR
jgi:hypothetical protein